MLLFFLLLTWKDETKEMSKIDDLKNRDIVFKSEKDKKEAKTNKCSNEVFVLKT